MLEVSGQHVPGIIPARAGSSLKRKLPCGASRDHPRACGEQSMFLLGVRLADGIIPARAGSSSPLSVLNRGARGSSPRVRGAGLVAHQVADVLGIIPARAGSSHV